jgi:hypothetical protein
MVCKRLFLVRGTCATYSTRGSSFASAKLTKRTTGLVNHSCLATKRLLQAVKLEVTSTGRTHGSPADVGAVRICAPPS